MTRPRLLDLFCGAGGAAMGYHRAGFDVSGIDSLPQPNYPFTFWRWDVTKLDAVSRFDAIHASPPCLPYTQASGGRPLTGRPGLIPWVREFLESTGLPYVIENVPPAPLRDPLVLCGTSFGLPIVRHRHFECSVPITGPSCGLGATQHHPKTYPYGGRASYAQWRDHVVPVVWPWMKVKEAGDAVPPEYTEHIGRQLL